ncbi:uncharacterized protein LOC111281525 [Durio zibethinus]|uniref:Uncharacterized protein LOC111281525 n=1 Tax=Durio zibethinus TaxID=66656 RepID=A0A6P5XB17_DURZI|nr:uncharacterized protein LOC111281525 [Durio zibethinus]
MHDSIGILACFSSSDQRQADVPASVGRSGQSVFMSAYRTKLAGQCRLINVTWCRNLLLHGLSVSVQGPGGDEHCRCKIELKSWYFWRKQGSKHFIVDGTTVDVVWDLKAAKFNGETEPQSDYYVAIVCEDEVVLLLGDQKKDAYRKTGCRPSLKEPMLVSRREHIFLKEPMLAAKFNGETEPQSDYCVAIVCEYEVVLLLGDQKKDAYRKTGCRPSLKEPMLVSRREHIFGRRKFATRVKFNDKGAFHDISVECNNSNSSNSSSDGFDPVLEIRVDGKLAIQINYLQWKFRGNESINVGKNGVEVFWDVHDWLFGSGPRNGLFIFNPIPSSSVPVSSISAPSSPPSSSSSLTSLPLSNQEVNSASGDYDNATGSSRFCLFLYAWKVE